MSIYRGLRWGAVGAAAILALASAGTAQAATKTALDKGGAFCLQVGSVEPGATEVVLALDIDPADHPPTKRKLWWVSGYEQGSNPSVTADNYVDTISGTATLGKPNDGASGAKVIHMGLTGIGNGTNADSDGPGVWAHTYSLQLKPKSLNGRITGFSVFTPISGGTAGEPMTMVVDERITQIKCKNV